jgi:multiple sugar transport system substrate-binding protein
MKSVLRRHWGVLFLSIVALSFITLQVFLSTHREKAATEIFFADRLTEAHLQLIDEYNRLHQGEVRVVPIDFPNPDFTTNERKEILARSLRGGAEGIDLFAVDVIWVQRFERWSEPLNPYFSAAEIEGFSEEGLRSCYKEGRLVAIPFARVRGVLIWREDLLRSLPGGNALAEEVNRGITWKHFVKYGETLHGSSPYYLYPAAEYEGLLCVFTEILLGREKNYFAVHGFNFDTPAAKKALQFLVDLVHKYRITPESAASMTEVSSYEYFIRHNGLFLRGWSTYNKDFRITPEADRVIRIAPLPHFEDGQPASTIGGWNLMVSKFSTKKEQAIAFAKFLLRKSSQELLYTKGGFFPVIRALYEEESYKKKFPELIGASTMLAYGVDRPSHEKYTKYSEILARYLSLAIRGRIRAEDALAGATKAIESDRTSTERGR